MPRSKRQRASALASLEMACTVVFVDGACTDGVSAPTAGAAAAGVVGVAGGSSASADSRHPQQAMKAHRTISFEQRIIGWPHFFLSREHAHPLGTGARQVRLATTEPTRRTGFTSTIANGSRTSRTCLDCLRSLRATVSSREFLVRLR